MSNIFKTGSTVLYGTVKATLLGIYNTNKAIIFSAEERVGFYTLSQIKECGNISNVLYFFINDFFKTRNAITSPMMKQHRFKIVNLSELKLSEHSSYKSLLNKRHCYLTLIKSNLKDKSLDSDREHKLCLRLQEVQSEIEFIEAKARQHLTDQV